MMQEHFRRCRQAVVCVWLRYVGKQMIDTGFVQAHTQELRKDEKAFVDDGTISIT
jgi:hypothetical protein